nr:MAG TPA: hypothetical protein [Caudoviricetes sp.]
MNSAIFSPPVLLADVLQLVILATVISTVFSIKRSFLNANLSFLLNSAWQCRYLKYRRD